MSFVLRRFGVLHSIGKVAHRRCCSTSASALPVFQPREERLLPGASLVDDADSVSMRDLNHPLRPVDGSSDVIVPVLAQPSFTLASHVNRSELLKQLVDLGVSLYHWDNMKDVHSWVMTLNFASDVQPIIQFLLDKGVDIKLMGRLFTKNPKILKLSMEELQARTDYLVSKHFQPEMIGRIYARNPFWLLFSAEKIDQRLGFFQQLFNLSGDQMRAVATKEPRLITSSLHNVKLMNFGMREEMGFSVMQIRSLALQKPKLWIMNKEILVRRFDYLHNVVKLDHAVIAQFPSVLATRDFRIRQRHEFLSHLHRAQYDPKLPNYVSPLMLVSDTDAHFAAHVAKSSVIDFNEFCKTL